MLDTLLLTLCDMLAHRLQLGCELRCLHGDRFGGAGRRGSTQVSNQVGNRGVGFVSDACYDGNGTFHDGTGELFIIEGHEVFVAAAAAYEQYDFDAGSKTRTHALDDIFRSMRAFDRNACYIDVGKRETAARCAQNVMNRIASW